MPSILDQQDLLRPLNTGVEGANLFIKRQKALCFVPKGTTVALSALAAASATATVKAGVLNDNADSRWYIVGPWGETANNSSETTRVTYTYGFEMSLYYGIPIYTYTPNNDDLKVLEVLQKFNNKAADFDVFIIDAEDKWLGTRFVDANGDKFFKGFAMSDIFTDGANFDTGEGAKQMMRVVFADPKQFNEGNLYVWESGIDAINNIPRMQTLTLEVLSPLTSGVVDVKVLLNGSTNFADTRNAGKLAVVGAWVATEDATDLAISPITSVAIVNLAGTKVYRVTIPTGNSNYPSSGDDLRLNVAAPSALAALASPLTGYESARYVLQEV